MVTPIYRRIVADIRDKIRTGQLKPGDQLPSIRQLRELYKAEDGTLASTTAIRNAMLVLQSEGLVEGHQGRGVYVTRPPES